MYTSPLFRIEKEESALITLLIVTALSKMFLNKAEFVFQQEAVKNKMTTSTVWYPCLDSFSQTMTFAFITMVANVSANAGNALLFL